MHPVINLQACTILKHANTMPKPLLKYVRALAKVVKMANSCTSNFYANFVVL